jgi:uncharacterized protein YcfJ
MNKSMLVGTVLGAVLVTAGGGFAGYQMMNSAPAAAEVLKVTEAYKTTKVPREVCEDRVVTRQAPVKDENRIAGSVVGAVVGGLLGKQVGGGNGKKLATVAGAAAGGYAGNQVQKNLQEKDTYTTTERVCNTVTDSRKDLVGYDVEYRIGEQVASVRMDHNPGDSIPLKDGKLVLSAQ